MSDLLTEWNATKEGLVKQALKNLLPAAKAVAGEAKMLPALAGEAKALKSVPKGTDSLAKVDRNIDAAAPSMRQAKGRVVEPPGGPKPTGTGGQLRLPAPAAAPEAGKLGPGAKLEAYWKGLTPEMKSRIKGTGLVGAGGTAGYLDGRGDGKEVGLTEGGNAGFDAGLAAGAQQGSVDPGIMGRLMEVFTGRTPGAVNPADPEMAYQRQAAIKRILAGQ